MTDHWLAAITEQSDGTYTIQLMDECDPDDDPHGVRAVLADELTVEGVMGP